MASVKYSEDVRLNTFLTILSSILFVFYNLSCILGTFQEANYYLKCVKSDFLKKYDPSMFSIHKMLVNMYKIFHEKKSI